ncbi:hypothetical protein DW088_02010 [Butyricicoccus sp. AM05-1]|uniref:hypothetical protein n=1 Tax=Butyricicoccus sp. AM05-1 TaxID=2292004 RepID=UPI000E554838|nr:MULTISPECIES: hypothetical protein [unclassified Butyricicoccus]RHO64999.1 hypothetical protein DW088_02010 [Butyricicoccus sp. AM05-1]
MTLDEAIEYWRKRTKDSKENRSYQSASLSEQHVNWLEELKELRAETQRSKDARPLTPYELMSMDGQEVWVVLKETPDYPKEIVPCFVDSINMNMIGNREEYVDYMLSFAPQSGRYWNEWVAYRNKPEVREK